METCLKYRIFFTSGLHNETSCALIRMLLKKPLVFRPIQKSGLSIPIFTMFKTM